MRREGADVGVVVVVVGKSEDEMRSVKRRKGRTTIRVASRKNGTRRGRSDSLHTMKLGGIILVGKG